MTDLFRLILGILASRFKARATLEAENLVLRQQINVLRRRTPKRPHLNNADRFALWIAYRGPWPAAGNANKGDPSGSGACFSRRLSLTVWKEPAIPRLNMLQKPSIDGVWTAPQQNQRPRGVPMMPMRVLFRSVFTVQSLRVLGQHCSLDLLRASLIFKVGFDR